MVVGVVIIGARELQCHHPYLPEGEGNKLCPKGKKVRNKKYFTKFPCSLLSNLQTKLHIVMYVLHI
jgi:hypothetical protein